MKKLCVILAIFIFFTSCSNSPDNDEPKGSSTDSVGLTNPIVIDTLKHPSGIDNSSVISTDTAAMNTQKSINRADSVERKKSNKK